MKIGQVICKEETIRLNQGSETTNIMVANTGDRPIQVGSHYHFFEVNRLLSFDRQRAYGFRLDIPSGTSERFEPGEERQVQLVKLGGSGEVYGLNDLVCGPLKQQKEAALAAAEKQGFRKEKAR